MSPSLEDYRVELDSYHGPLDLLLFLVRRHEIDLHDIPVAQLADQYMAHLEKVRQIDIDTAGEFLVMAATLLEIKSRLIAPAPADAHEGEGDDAQLDDEGFDTTDPRYELIRQLLAYKRFKDAAHELDDRRRQWELRFAHRPGKKPRGEGASAGRGEGGRGEATGMDEMLDDEAAVAEALEVELEDVNIQDLTEAFARLMASVGQGPARHEVVYDDTPIELHAEDIVDRLDREGPLTLQKLFIGRRNRGEMIGLFLATLELVKLKRIRVIQGDPSGEISLQLRPQDEQLQDSDDTEHTWRNAETGEVEYEWPSEEARLRAERRAKRRAEKLSKREFGESEEDEDEDVIDFEDEQTE